jgi:peptide/nickel transport system ATP-binding protein
MKDAHLRLNGLSVFLPDDHGDKHIVQDVSLNVPHGELLALIGESGSGKSMTCSALAGILPARMRVQGTALLDGVDLLAAPQCAPSRSSTAIIFQNPSQCLNPVRTIGFQLVETVRMHRGLAKRQARTAALDALSDVGLDGPERLMHAYPHQLSGGMNQRVMIALALATDPRLLIADEPTSSLDVTTQRQILDLLEDLRRQRTMTVLMVTHDLSVALERADRIGVLHDGRLVETGKAGQVLTAPQHPFTRRLVAALPKLGGAQRSIAPDTVGNEPANMPQGASLAFKGVTFRYPQGRLATLIGRPAPLTVTNIGFEIAPGKCVGLIGESGSGKSTLARLALGFETPSSGQVLVDGKPIDDWPRRAYRQAVQPIFQDPHDALNPSLRILDQVAEPLTVQGLASRVDARNQAMERLEAVGLPVGIASRLPHQISGGQAQRVVIARALMLRPRLLVADEAVSALDMTVQAQILTLLRDLIEREGLSCLFVSHDLRAVSTLCDRLVVLYRGQVVEQGRTEHVIARPEHPYTRRLLSAVPKGRNEQHVVTGVEELVFR